MLHGIGPAVAGLALLVACAVFAGRYAGQGRRGWVAYCVATAIGNLALTGASFSGPDYRLMLAGSALAWIWAAVVTAHELRR